MNNKQLLKQALDVLASYDAEEFEHGAEVMQALRAAIDQLTLSVGDSHFESWYSEYPKSGGSMKPQMRDAYAAGMGDPLVAIAQPESKPVAWFNAKRDMTYLSNHYADDIPLYTAPVQTVKDDDLLTIAYMAGTASKKPSYVPLSDEQIKQIVIEACDEQFGIGGDIKYTDADTEFYGIAFRAIEKAVRGEK